MPSAVHNQLFIYTTFKQSGSSTCSQTVVGEKPEKPACFINLGTTLCNVLLLKIKNLKSDEGSIFVLLQKVKKQGALKILTLR